MRNMLFLRSYLLCDRKGGFRVDSPVRSGFASEMLRSAPPYTNGTLEEPWEGDVTATVRFQFFVADGNSPKRNR
jgi:hypothetical protein